MKLTKNEANFLQGQMKEYSDSLLAYLLSKKEEVVLCDDFEAMIGIVKDQNLKYLNIGGVVGNFENPKEYALLNEEKLGFNTTVSEYIGEFDIVLNPFTYNLYTKMNKRK